MSKPLKLTPQEEIRLFSALDYFAEYAEPPSRRRGYKSLRTKLFGPMNVPKHKAGLAERLMIKK